MKFYWLCAGSSDSASRAVYPRRTEIRGHIYGDSLQCAWLEMRIACDAAPTPRRDRR
jgi:hypothetical protein